LTDKSDVEHQLREQDKIDLNNELAGIEGGRNPRFLSPEDERTPEGREKKRKRQAAQTLHLRLLNLHYRQLYFKVEAQLIKTENTARQALALIENRLDASDNTLADMRSKAAHLPDGTAIFRDSTTGDIYTEKGKHLAAHEILNIPLSDDAPT